MKYLLILSMMLPQCLHAQSIAEKADALMNAYCTQHKFSGNVLIAVKHKVVFEKSYGYADRENRLLNSEHTQFRAGSLTKMFTSALVMRLVEEKKISLDDPVSKFVNGIDSSGKIHIRHLLSHTSGLKGSTAPGARSMEALVQGYKAETSVFEPGSKFEYNNFNYILLGYICGQLMHRPFATLLKEGILDKANMYHSGIDSNARVSSTKAFGYVTDPQTSQWVKTGEEEVAVASGAGALYTTTGDLFEWSKHMYHTGILSSASWKIVQTPVQPGYGLGWIIGENNGHAKVGHTGSIPGFIADFLFFPKDSITIIYLSNYQDLDGRKLERDLTAISFGEPYQLPVQHKEISVSEDILKEYVGTYQLDQHTQIKLVLENKRLIAIPPGGDRIELTPEAKDLFFLKGPEIVVSFSRVDGGLDAMLIDMQGGQHFKKLKQ